MMNTIDSQRLIAITGGIGTGKSVVCKILSAMGYEVYDCDSRAKQLMDNDLSIIKAIEADVCSEAVTDNKIDRCILAERVFSDKSLLANLNRIVHSAVRADFSQWSKHREIAFVETAILYTSGMDSVVTEVWNVTAPEEMRIRRIKTRNPGLSEAQILKRIESQQCEMQAAEPHALVFPIINDDCQAILPQIERLLQR